MNLSAMKDVIWSEMPQSCMDVMGEHSAPLLVRVEQGYCSEEDGDSLGQGQIIRICKWLKKQRIIAKDMKGRHFSFPVEFPVPFEVCSEKKRTLKRKSFKTLAEIVKSHSLPKTVRLKEVTTKYAEYAIASSFGREPLELLRIHEETYLHGNAVNYGSIDPTIINIPIHGSLELTVGLGLEDGDESQWNQLLKDLDDIIAKEARYGTTCDNQKILIFMPARNDDDDDVLQTHVPGSLSSIDDDIDDVIRAYGADDVEDDHDSTDGRSTSGTSLSCSVGSNEIINGDATSVDSTHSDQNGISFTNYTQRTSFMLEDGSMMPINGRAPLNLEGFFNDKGGNGDNPGEKSMFKSNVARLSFLRPEHWGFASTDTPPEEPEPVPSEQTERRSSVDLEGKMYMKVKNGNISKHAKKIINKIDSRKSKSSDHVKDLAPNQRLRNLSALPLDIYQITAQQVLDLLKLLELSEYAPMFAFDRIDGRVLSKLTLNDLETKYGMTEAQAGHLLAQVHQKDLEKEDDRSLTAYQTTNGALSADYQIQSPTALSTFRYF